MRWLIMIMMLPGWVLAQVTDDFSDGNFTQNPVWTGDQTHFEVSTERQLHLLSAGSDTSVLLTRSYRSENSEWNFWVKMSFNTSLNNYSRIYLMADSSDMNSAGAVFLQAGGSSDSIVLVEKSGGQYKTFYRFNLYQTAHSVNTLRFRILHEAGGKWEAWIDTTGGTNFIRDGAFIANPAIQPRWFGVYCRYTTSNALKFWFDDFYVGPIRYDTINPTVQSIEVIPDSTIRVSFSEPVKPGSAMQLSNYRLASDGHPLRAVQESGNPAAIILTFSTLMPEGVLDTLVISGITDLSGNVLADTAIPAFHYRPLAYDVVITEIHADPEPVVGLPAEEFLELYNRSRFPLNMKGWNLRFGSYNKVFPKITIPAHGYLILSKSAVYQNYGLYLPLFTSTTSLANEGTTLVLSDNQKHIIHSVTFTAEWYDPAYKAEGGWSLEMVDPGNPCGCRGNWKSSLDPAGGTPGKANSTAGANPDEDPPRLLHAFLADSATAEVVFNEPLDSLSLLPVNRYLCSGGGEHLQPAQVSPVPPDYSRLKLHFEQPFSPAGQYRLQVSDSVRDCAGNGADQNKVIGFGFPDTLEPGDLVINEILFDPAGDGSRFVEIYNCSDKILDMKMIVMAAGDSSGNLIADAKPVVNGSRLSFPGDYYAIAKDPAEIAQRYRVPVPDVLIPMAEFPSMASDSGIIGLMRRDDLAIIDEVRYSVRQHYPLLSSTEGVSLERASPDLPSAYSDNWHSAAETAGFATPGYRNSQWYLPGDDGTGITVEPPVFSPDNDGYNDLAAIVIREENPSCSVRIHIFDSRGRLVRRLVNNSYAGTESVFFWDGMSDDRQKSPVGIYVVNVEILYPEGKVTRKKEAVVLTGRF